MVTIRVFGTTPPCAKYQRTEREALKAAAKYPGQVQVVKLDALGPEASEIGVVMTPTVVVGKEVLPAGKIVLADQLETYIRRALGG